MVKTADGAVVAAWVFKGDGMAVTRHIGDSSTVLGLEKGDKQSIPNLIHPTIDSKGRIWLSGSFPRIYRTDGNGGIVMVHEFTPEDFRSREKKRMLTSNLYNPIHCDEDGLGRMWVWSGTCGVHISHWGPNPNLDPSPSLHGVYTVSEDKWELHDDLGAIQGADILCVARFDNQHMIASDSENGVYKVDIQNWTTQDLHGPQWELRNVNEMFVDGGDIYALDRNTGTHLWRWSNVQWNEVVSDFERTTNGMGYSPRPRFRMKEGLIVQGSEHTWLLPNTGPAKMPSWKSAFPVSKIKAMVQLKDGTFCILASETATETDTQIYYCGMADPSDDWSSHRIVEVEPDRAWLSSKHFWMIPRQDSTVLKEWNGKTWLSHSIPKPGRGDNLLNEDDQGRIWIYNADGTVNLFDLAKSQWQSFSDLDSCLAATKGNPVHLQHFWTHVFPRYSSDKQRIAYCHEAKLHYFNGSVWQIFRWSDISGWPGEGALNSPWFDAQDKLCVGTQARTTWQFGENGQWHSIPFTEHLADDYDSPKKTKFSMDTLPEGCPIQNPHSIQTDNLGAFWFTKDGNLYRCIGDQCVSVFEPTEITPFNSTPYLKEVDVDSQGDAFIECFAAETRRYLILAKRPPPQTAIDLKRTNEDSIVATFNPHSDGVTNFRWQLDDGPTQLSKSNSLALDHLPNGAHVLKVTAIDDQLNMDASPAKASFETKIDTTKQIELLVNQLLGPDHDLRKSAVEALAKQPGNSLPALTKARETASDDQRWWIDAAIQECEREVAKAGK